jgi:endonuclease/exonuclease/phosphatase family metal-dependent hydrolase
MPDVNWSKIISGLTAVQNSQDLHKRLTQLAGDVAEMMAWLGDPASKAESTNRIGGKYRYFTNGILYRYTHDDGKHAWGAVPRGGVYELWTESGWEYGPFGYPIGLPEANGNKTVCRFEGGTITSVAEKPRQVMFYNTALIGVDVAGVTQDRLEGEILGVSVVDEKVYTGRGRAAQLKALIDKVSRCRADVVVLAEMMGNQDRATLKKAVKGTYPHSIDGPDEDDPEEDSGLLVLSRHPMFPVIAEARHKGDVWGTVFRSCCGVDCFANKGAAMVRVSPNDGPDFYVVGTHLQNGDTDCSWPTNAGVGSGAKGKRDAQLRHLDSWILGARRDLDLPVVVVGDFNIDANTPEGRKSLAANLPDARDLMPEYQMWLPTDVERVNAITSPSRNESSYRAGSPKRTSMIPQDGSRIDLALVDQGERITAHVTRMGVWAHDLEPGIDLSDHYAITADLGMSTVTHKLNRKARSTTAWLKYIHALELTDGAGVPHWSKKDPDEVDVTARIYKGKPGSDGRPSARVAYDPRTMSMGERHEYSYKPAKTLIFDGIDDVHMKITLNEVGFLDPTNAIGRDREVIAPKSSQLLHAYKGRRYAPNVMYGNGSEYVAVMHVDVDLEPLSHRE